jgi:hypothetical protein
MHLNIRRTSLLATLSFFLSASICVAEKKPPKGSTPTDPNTIVKLYAGKTSFWDRGGVAYWGPGGKFRSTGGKGTAYGEGKWYVTTASKLCQETIYHWSKDGAVESEDYKGCWEFKTAPDGVIWERFLPEETEWYRHRTDKQKNGNAAASTIKAAARKFGF